jgi:hypothetical protein
VGDGLARGDREAVEAVGTAPTPTNPGDAFAEEDRDESIWISSSRADFECLAGGEDDVFAFGARTWSSGCGRVESASTLFLEPGGVEPSRWRQRSPRR